MRALIPFLLSVAICCPSLAQTIPAGTILPAQLQTTVRSNKVHPGQQITLRIMQDVPLATGLRIRAGSKVTGHVVRIGQSNPAELALRFDSIRIGKRQIAVLTNLRAMANMMDVFDAQLPINGPDRGTSEFDSTTEQIGGEASIHSAGLLRGSHIIGQFVPGGVLAVPAANPNANCRGPLPGNNEPQALWLFSSDACGLYDMGDLTLLHAGRTSPQGEIILRSLKGPVVLHSGSGLLLRVIG